MPSANKMTGPVIIGGIALIGAWSTAKMDWSFHAPFSDGVTQEALQESFDDALVIRDVAVAVWGNVLWDLFGQTSPGAVPGHEGWLFTEEEFVAGPGFEDRLTSAIAHIVDANDRLASQNMSLVIALVPDKARIMSVKLRAPRAPQVEARYDAVLTGLRAAGVEVADLRPALRAAHVDAPVFLKTDTHWTPFGAQAVAHALAPQISSLVDQTSSFVTETAGSEMREGDLMQYLPLGKRAAAHGFPAERIPRFATVAEASANTTLGLFGDTPQAGVLVGTSFSANPLWHFDGWLKQATGIDFLNQAKEGGGPFPPMQALLNNQSADPPAVVIWDIPERYLGSEETKPAVPK